MVVTRRILSFLFASTLLFAGAALSVSRFCVLTA
jgi:hypothetical protein